ncbi:hypothetical protein SERLA73DRAFT_108042 [Serpula lacrymans var. lacrymans S7.3]|uniref:BHLH domain-containing protein n=2 Tax=Serpula lacrymans var. lacrymans TaxID=341189 RepID=F8PYA1_SERL3|nr:uncharacterized protein SERLADRAFT_438062 [Serpula lacrymans var. lacrymans S7.9]EGN98864.1 hypothetical protein SERLA73DRAFT_108042 [Serpula lacrymans var. lacrymans S7.3]EGO24444.1 hypothetical protein SERLADRAFT_438062 [Serpula lacrymans var. lacrymans S7.9]
MMSLLTPSESHAFQSFLSSLDCSDFSPEWDMQLEIAHDDVQPAHGREALEKATKDLMALDAAEKWKYPLVSQPPQPLRERSVTPMNRDPHPQANCFSFLYSTRQNQRSSNPSSEFTRTKSKSKSLPVPVQTSARSRLHSPPLHRTVNPISVSTSSARHQSPSSLSSHSPLDSSASSSTLIPPVASLPPSKRSPPAETTHSNKRPRPSPSSSHDTVINSRSNSSSKPTLLSPSQKKANHIQSEQKRRANIRRGYEALCDTVPALREAIQLEEEENNRKGKKRRGRGKTNEDGDKVDGRAGPRSENVVLSKTIDYINDLLYEREDLLERMKTAQQSLPHNHPLLNRDRFSTPPLWERKWTGGEQKDGDDDEDEEEEED